jgi:hypothetical protein
MNHRQQVKSAQPTQSGSEPPAWVTFPALEKLNSREGHALLQKMNETASQLETVVQTGTASSKTRAVSALNAYRRALEIIDLASAAPEQKDVRL